MSEEYKTYIVRSYHEVFAFLHRHEKEGAFESLLDLFNKTSSVLLKHEVAYVLGQTEFERAESFLLGLAFGNEDEIVRHEAVEALSSVTKKNKVTVSEKLEALLDDGSRIVAESAMLALEDLSLSTDDETKQNSFGRLDPLKQKSEGEFSVLVARLTDPLVSLPDKYRVLAALRDEGLRGAEAIATIFGSAEGALLKHEASFVLGQLCFPESSEVLLEAAENINEHVVVRHEALISLGAIGNKLQEEGRDTVFLEKRLDTLLVQKLPEIVKESAWVALAQMH